MSPLVTGERDVSLKKLCPQSQTLVFPSCLKFSCFLCCFLFFFKRKFVTAVKVCACKMRVLDVKRGRRKTKGGYTDADDEQN